ncbi:MAG: type II toxin-antitoxin system RelE/ParE family toxin [Defluviitaleaceae bacterium]|nr:type II toxin-antitoxin system RelE/ParE family toxin [Defluviitaleaceae bacterium]
MDKDEKNYNVLIDPAANDKMYGHFEFLAKVSETAAEKLLDGLIEDIRPLEYMPHRNPVYYKPHLRNGKYRYMISQERYRIVYQIEENMIFVTDI